MKELRLTLPNIFSWKVFTNSHSQMFFKIGVLKNFAIFRGKTLCWSLFLINVAGHPATLNETPTQAFSCGYCKIFQNIFFEEHIQKAAPGVSWFSSICVASSYKETTPPVLKLDWIQLLNIQSCLSCFISTLRSLQSQIKIFDAEIINPTA